MFRKAFTSLMVMVVLGSGVASQNLANTLGRADFGQTRKCDDRRCFVAQ